MRGMEIMGAWQELCANDARALASEGVWFVRQTTGDLSLALQPAHASQSTRVTLPAGYCGLLMFGRGQMRAVGGTLHYHALHCDVLVKLLAFMDEARVAGPCDAERHESTPTLHCVPVDAFWTDRRQCEIWFLSQLAAPSDAFCTMLSVLRRGESYKLVRFLLSRSHTGGTLRHMCAKYGVSYSHFRRLCRCALGESAKIVLRDWRMARSMLEVAQGSDSYTEIALRNGYASSSHFSTEIKELIGMSPTHAAGSLRTLAR
ncbi:Invasion protein InvF [Pandoraea iniqua]|uniref:helix-turn-helix domain-containing protein n=1 Tax=Pandoraea iniqua TaxID=2508288 RepID=UPI00123F3B76|nr:helix-turn-helix domain-containing protein [Pandoraea iniqua]VVD64270.1 Invasion protein InvF [Pandoraea iniqua]